MQACEGLQRVRGSKAPEKAKFPTSLTARLDEFHPQREHTETVIAIAIPVVVVAVETVATEVTDSETVAVQAESVRPHPVEADRRALARALEVHQDETADHRRRAEARQVVSRESVVLTPLREELYLLVNGLVLTLVEQARDKEHEARLRRLVVLQCPALEVPELFIARTDLRRMVLEGEALADTPADRAGVAKVRGELAPLDRRLSEVLGHILVIDRNKKLVNVDIHDE